MLGEEQGLVGQSSRRGGGWNQDAWVLPYPGFIFLAEELQRSVRGVRSGGLEQDTCVLSPLWGLVARLRGGSIVVWIPGFHVWLWNGHLLGGAAGALGLCLPDAAALESPSERDVSPERDQGLVTTASSC